jgi:hypothetical protein
MEDIVTTPTGLEDIVTTPTGLEDIVTTPTGLEDIVTTPTGLEDIVTTPTGLEDIVTTPTGLDDDSGNDTEDSCGSFTICTREELTARGDGFCSNQQEQRRLRCRQDIFGWLERRYTAAEILDAHTCCNPHGFMTDGTTFTPFEGARDLAKACAWLRTLTSNDAWQAELVVDKKLPLAPKLTHTFCQPSVKSDAAECLQELECGCTTNFGCDAIEAFSGGLLAYLATETGKRNEYENEVSERVDNTRYSMSVVNFMVQNIDRMQDPGFVGLLRAHILAFPYSINRTADNMPLSLRRGEFDGSYNALQLCASCNQVPLDVMRTILEAGAGVNYPTRLGRTPLMLFMSYGWTMQTAKVKLLLDFGANIDAFDDQFQTVLHVAARSGKLEGIRLVLDARRERIKYEEGRKARQNKGQRIRITGTGYWPAGGGGIGRRRPLYIDPLHMPDCENETPLTIAIGTELRPYMTGIKLMNDRRRDMVKLLIDAGSDADFNLYRDPCPPAWEHMDIRMESVREQRIDMGWRSHELDEPLTTKPPFLCYGMVSSLTRDDGSNVLNFKIRKEFYDVSVWIDADFVHEYLTMDNGDFPGWMDEDDITNAFVKFSGKRFDFYETEEYVEEPDDYGSDSDDDTGMGGDDDTGMGDEARAYPFRVRGKDGQESNMPKIDGADFDIYFTVEHSTIGHHHVEMVLSSDMSKDQDTAQKFAMRFPRGPTQRVFNDEIPGLDIEITMREHLTCLQHAAKCHFTRQRVNMLRSVISRCNPLIEDGRGRTAVEILENTLAVEGAITTKWVSLYPDEPWRSGKRLVTPPCKTDERLVKRMRQDHDEMAAFLNLSVVKVAPTSSMEIDTAHPTPETTSKEDKKKKAKNNTLVSPFLKLPVDVCRIIHGFICPLRK